MSVDDGEAAVVHFSGKCSCLFYLSTRLPCSHFFYAIRYATMENSISPNFWPSESKAADLLDVLRGAISQIEALPGLGYRRKDA